MSACLCDCLCLSFNVISVCFSLSIGLTVFFSFSMTYSTVNVIVCLAFCLFCILSVFLSDFLSHCLSPCLGLRLFLQCSGIITSNSESHLEFWRHHKVHRIPSPAPPPPPPLPFPSKLNTAERRRIRLAGNAKSFRLKSKSGKGLCGSYNFMMLPPLLSLLSSDGILGHIFDTRLESSAPCYSLLQADFKENHTLLCS
jgi:hypothetical protein